MVQCQCGIYWMEGRQKMMTLLQEEAELEEIVKMVGMDALSPGDRLKMEAARSIVKISCIRTLSMRSIRITSLKKQHMMMKLVMAFYEKAVEALSGGASLQDLINMPVREQIGRFKLCARGRSGYRIRESKSGTGCGNFCCTGEGGF